MCQFIYLNEKHQTFTCPILFRLDWHILAEQPKESERLIWELTKFKNVRTFSDKTTNQRPTQEHTLNENNDVEFTTIPLPHH